MGQLLKPRVVTKAEAKLRLDADLAAAHERYERRIAAIDARRTQGSGRFEELPTRARNIIKFCLMTEGPPNGFGRPTWVNFEGEVTPELVASKVTALDILRQPNGGHKTVDDIAAWLEASGLELMA